MLIIFLFKLEKKKKIDLEEYFAKRSVNKVIVRVNPRFISKIRGWGLMLLYPLGIIFLVFACTSSASRLDKNAGFLGIFVLMLISLIYLYRYMHIPVGIDEYVTISNIDK